MAGRNETALAEAMEQIKAEGGGRGASIAADLLDRSTLGDVVAEPSPLALPTARPRGIAQLTRAMTEAWSPFGIVSNAIAPSFFPTELTRKVYENPNLLAHNAGMTAIGRNGELSDLDGVTVFLASTAANYLKKTCSAL